MDVAVDFISEAVHRMHHAGRDRQGSGGEGVVFSVRLIFVQSPTVKLDMCSSCLVQGWSRKEGAGRFWLRSVVDYLSKQT